MSRTFIAHSALGDQLKFRQMGGHEEMGRLFEFKVDLLSDSDSIDPKSLLGTDLTVEVDLTTEIGGGGTRYLSGQVTGFKFAGRDGNFCSYRATLHPWLWLATRRSDFKIFQNKTVPDIVQEVLAPYGFVVENKLCNSYRTWEYCVQYGETDFNFISRLLEHEGAYYYFSHQMGSHHLVLADSLGSHSPLPNGPTTIPYYPGNRAAVVHDSDFLDSWNALQDIASGKFTSDDYDFTKPRALLDTYQAQPAGHAFDSEQIYHWPGGYTEVGDGENYARVRIEQQEAQRETIHAIGNARNLAPGYLFNLDKYPRADQNQQYLITAADYRFTENVERSDGGGADTPTTYRLDIDAVPSSVPWHSQPSTHKPRTAGPQTAVVVGPASEEIYTDEYGRIKVQFHWDRYGTNDENSSCWIRVSQTWAGANYGSMHIPRIGQEVVVDFLNGDPDFPLITGRVYNAMQMPPWDLPANKTQSGIKTRSSKDGTPGDGMKNSPGMANAIRFEDLAGSEQLWLHAQKDQLTEVENQEDKWVGADRNKTIDGNETNVIHKNRTETVDQNETITIHQNRTETVDQNETITIHQNRTETVDMNEAVTIHQNQQHTVDLNRTRHVGVDEDVTIGVNQSLTVGVNRTKSIGVNESDTIGSNWSIKVGTLETETIGLGYMQNIGVFKIENTGVIYSENIGMVMSTTVGMVQSTAVGMNRSVSVGQNQSTTIGQDHTLTVGSASNVTVGNALNVTAQVINLTATSLIKLSVGSSFITITPDGIDIESPLDELNCGGSGGGFGGGGSSSAAPQNKSSVPDNVNDAAGRDMGATSNTANTNANTPAANANAPIAKASTVTPPKDPQSAPQTINMSNMQSSFDKQWANSFPGGNSQEQGSTIVSDAQGNLSVTNIHSGASGQITPDVSVGPGQTFQGTFHTHPYDASEFGYTGASFSGGDAASLIDVPQQKFSIVQSGDDQFMYLRTAQTSSYVNPTALNNAQNQRISTLIGQGMSFPAATQKAAAETAQAQGLAYYQGKNGIFQKLNP